MVFTQLFVLFTIFSATSSSHPCDGKLGISHHLECDGRKLMCAFCCDTQLNCMDGTNEINCPWDELDYYDLTTGQYEILIHMTLLCNLVTYNLIYNLLLYLHPYITETMTMITESETGSTMVLWLFKETRVTTLALGCMTLLLLIIVIIMQLHMLRTTTAETRTPPPTTYQLITSV